MEATDYILAGTPERESTVAQNAAMQVEQKNIPIASLVSSMGDYITGDDLIQQVKSVEYLAAVLEKLSSSFLPRQDVSLLITYLTTRIKTAHVAGVKETARSLRALAAMDRFDSNDSLKVCRGIFLVGSNFNQNSASARFEVYKLIDFFLNEHRDTIKKMEGEFIDGILLLAEPEKDPRCLMLFFSILEVILIEWNIEAEVKDLWESVGRYFPITFRAKPDDPIDITPTELKLRLRNCISATSDFAPMAFPFLIDKLDYQVTANVKKDVMETLSACIEHYNFQPVATWSSQIWDALKFEILNATEDELASQALDTLKILAEYLSYDRLTLQTLERTPLFHFIDIVGKECVEHLHEPQQRYSQRSGQIIGKVASGSPFAFHLIIKRIFPELMTIIQGTHALTKKNELLEVINKVLDARFEIFQSQESAEFPSQGILDAVSESCAVGTIAYGGFTFYRDVLFETFAANLTNSPSQEITLRITAVKGLLKLVRLPGFLAQNEVGMIIQQLDKLVLKGDNVRRYEGSTLRDHAIEALREIARIHQQPIIDICFSTLLATLPETKNEDEQANGCLSVLEALGRISSDGFLFEILSLRLKNKLDDVLRRNVSQDYARTILAGMLYSVRQREVAGPRGGFHTDAPYIDLVIHLYRLVACPEDQASYPHGLRTLVLNGSSELPDDILLNLVGKTGMIIVRSMTTNNQMWAASNVFSLFGPSTMSESDISLATQLHNRTLILSMYLIAGLERGTDIGFNPQQVCCALIQNVSDNIELLDEAQESAIFIIALLFNKWTFSAAAQPRIAVARSPQELILEILKNLATKTSNQVENVLRMSIVFTMAANLKGAPGTSELLHMLVQLLGSKEHGSYLARNFKLILTPSELLSKENFIVMRGPYKQRPYAVCVPQIIDMFKMCQNPEIKSNYLVALSGILKHTPSEIILPEIESLLPMILQSMETFEPTVKADSIEVLRTVIVESPSSVEGHLRSIINRLYDRIRDTLDDPTDALAPSLSTVRIMALKCLTAIARHLNSAITLRYKTEVLKELGQAFKDVKRRIRHEAAMCKLAWLLLSENTENSE